MESVIPHLLHWSKTTQSVSSGTDTTMMAKKKSKARSLFIMTFDNMLRLICIPLVAKVFSLILSKLVINLLQSFLFAQFPSTGNSALIVHRNNESVFLPGGLPP